MLKIIVIVLNIVLSLSAIVFMAYSYWRDRQTSAAVPALAIAKKAKLILTGFIAFVADTVGIGSFAVNIAFCKHWRLVHDDDLPGMVNCAQVLPGAIESIIFLGVIQVDILTVITLVIGTCIGGIIGGLVVSKLDLKHTQLTMAWAFVLLALLVLVNQLHLLPIGGSAKALHGWKLWVGFFGMIFCGFVPALGVGLFAVVQVFLFLLGLSPLVAFPIMTTAGALQQPLTSITFIANDRVPLLKTFIISLAGVAAVLLTIPFVTGISLSMLRWILLVIIIYNAVSMFRSYYRRRSLAL